MSVNASAAADRYEPKPFLSTHRAASVCAREFARLSDELVLGATALEPGATERPVVRQSPERCIVQLGDVAITASWLRSNAGTVADGELLVVVWEGAIAPRGDHCPERTPRSRGARTATALWEETLTPAATSEATWSWQPGDVDLAPCSSTELAARCVERLGRTIAERRAA